MSVRDFGAVGDGKTDDTAAFEKAMAMVAPKGGTVSVPVGNYLINTHLVVPAQVTLEGVWKIPTASTENLGSTLLAVEGEGKETGQAFITLTATPRSKASRSSIRTSGKTRSRRIPGASQARAAPIPR